LKENPADGEIPLSLEITNDEVQISLNLSEKSLRNSISDCLGLLSSITKWVNNKEIVLDSCFITSLTVFNAYIYWLGLT